MSFYTAGLHNRHHDNDGFNEPCKDCYRVATHVLLLPPVVAKPTPSRVFLAGEGRTWGKARRRAIPTYCKACAYEKAGIPLPA